MGNINKEHENLYERYRRDHIKEGGDKDSNKRNAINNKYIKKEVT
jgi:hypothetical protein|tara:strand:+ start:397 stop:531 length:135 start_codon:yes stop_codon:yes gene_type:complete